MARERCWSCACCSWAVDVPRCPAPDVQRDRHLGTDPAGHAASHPGFAVGGEISGASAMILEHSPFRRRGHLREFHPPGCAAGQVLAAAVFLPLSAIMSKEAFESWGSRIPFLLSALVSTPATSVRRKVDETPAFAGIQARRSPERPDPHGRQGEWHRHVPGVLQALMNAIPTVVTVFGATFATNAGYGIGLTTTNYLWISVLRQRRGGDPHSVRRKSVRRSVDVR